MQTIQSFTVITTFLDRARKATFDELHGLTVHGVTISEARAICGLLEALDGPQVARLLQEQAAKRVAQTPPQEPTRKGSPVADMPPPVPPSAPEEPAQTPEPEPAPVAAPQEEEPSQEAAGSSDAEPADTSALRAQDPSEDASVGDAPRKSNPKAPKRGPKKPPPRVQDLPPESLKKQHPAVGEEHEGVKVTAVIPHGDGGVLLKRADHWRIKLDKNGKEVKRLEGAPDIESDVTPADQLEKPEEPKEPVERNVYTVPEEVLQDPSARTLLGHVIDKTGLKDEDSLVVECMKWKAEGAKAFQKSKDEAGVRRRVRASMTVMGL